MDFSLFDFKLAVKSSHISLDVLSNYRKSCVQKEVYQQHVSHRYRPEIPEFNSNLHHLCPGMKLHFGYSGFPAIKVIDPFRIRRATSVPLGKGTKFALHHGKMLTAKRRAIQILHSTFQFTFKCGYNYFISKYTDINSFHVTQIDLLHNDTFCST